MKSFLLDTNVIVDALRKRNGRHLLVDHFLDEGLPLASCPITITEIYAGMRPHEERPTRTFMRSLLFFAITEEIAEQAGLLKGALRETWADPFIPGCQHRGGLHRVRLHARYRERQGFPDARAAALSAAPKRDVAKYRAASVALRIMSFHAGIVTELG
jgi:predicted nucleic acid-binding protein